jgi:sugar fermentation stimulation protein A
MQFPNPLVKAQLVRRYKRFLTDAKLESGEIVTAHCANPGSMIGLTEPGAEIWLSPAQNPQRKLRWSWEMIRVGKSLVGINTLHPNKIVFDAIAKNLIPEVEGYKNMRREVKYGKSSRIDIFLEDPRKGACFVEVKNVHLKRNAGAEFPDSVTARGTKHLFELRNMVSQGHRAVMLYLVQREDCKDFRIAGDIDPKYHSAFETALDSGVEALCYSCQLQPSSIEIDRSLRIVR